MPATPRLATHRLRAQFASILLVYCSAHGRGGMSRQIGVERERRVFRNQFPRSSRNDTGAACGGGKDRVRERERVVCLIPCVWTTSAVPAICARDVAHENELVAHGGGSAVVLALCREAYRSRETGESGAKQEQQQNAGEHRSAQYQARSVERERLAEEENTRGRSFLLDCSYWIRATSAREPRCANSVRSNVRIGGDVASRVHLNF